MASENWSNWWVIVPMATFVIGGSIVGILSNTGRSTWFNTLIKPSINPPSWLFSVVWPVLYGLMGVSFWFVLKQWSLNSAVVLKALILFGIQYGLNLAWSPVFSKSESLLGSLLLIGILDVFALWTTVEFWSISALSGGLLIPYLIWISFATALNYEFARLNSDKI